MTLPLVLSFSSGSRIMAKDSSPFHGTEFHPIEDIYTKKGRLFGLKTQDGKILVNFDHSTSYGMLVQIARITGCEIVVIHGTWTFLPMREDVVNDEDSAGVVAESPGINPDNTDSRLDGKE